MKIAVYTIALNEQAHVERWANSAREADYRIVADTGSSDDTVERLTAAGISVYRIAIRPWRFDDARNAALALVPSDADLCISLDMDEFLVPGWRDVVEDAAKRGATRLTYNYAFSYHQDGTPAIVYRRAKIHGRWGYRWKRLMHEEVRCVGPEETHIVVDALLIGQIQDIKKDRKTYLPLLEQAHAEDPTDSQICFWLARDLKFAGRNTESADKFIAYLALPASTWPDERAEAMRLLAQLQPEAARGWLHKAITEAPRRREVWLDMAELHYAHKDWASLFWACINGIEKTSRTGSYLDNPQSWGPRLFDPVRLPAGISAWSTGRRSGLARRSPSIRKINE